MENSITGGLRRSLPRNVVRHSSGKLRALVKVRGKQVAGPLRDTAKEALADLAKIRGDTAEPLAVELRPTLADALEAVCTNVLDRGGRKVTADFYRKEFRYLTGPCGWGRDYAVADITPGQIEHYIRERRGQVSIESVVKELHALRRMLRLAMKRGWRADDPFVSVDVPMTRAKRYQFMVPERIERCLAAIRSSTVGRPQTRERDALMVELFFLTGMRRAELGRLRVRNVDFEAGLLYIDEGKTNARTFPIEGRLVDVLRQLIAGRRPQDHVYADWKTIESACARWKKRTGERLLTPHTLRHSFGSAMADRGVSPFQLATLMGHSDVKQTFRYYHGRDEGARDAVRRLMPQEP